MHRPALAFIALCCLLGAPLVRAQAPTRDVYDPTPDWPLEPTGLLGVDMNTPLQAQGVKPCQVPLPKGGQACWSRIPDNPGLIQILNTPNLGFSFDLLLIVEGQDEVVKNIVVNDVKPQDFANAMRWFRERFGPPRIKPDGTFATWVGRTIVMSYTQKADAARFAMSTREELTAPDRRKPAGGEQK